MKTDSVRSSNLDRTVAHPAIRLSERDRSRLALLGVLLITFLASLPLLLPYLPDGYDILFHSYRIDGIAQGLRDGQFPVRMQTTQIEGLGYPVSICYGDLFLYLPAVLRLVGLPLRLSWAVFVASANLFCAAIAYITARRATRSRAIGITAAALWTLSPYRLLFDVWIRVAVGEYLALGFLPMVAYGLFSIFWEDQPGASGRGWLWIALGAAGIVYSHVISALLAFLLFAPISLALLLWRRSGKACAQLALSLVVALLLSAAFLLPLADYYAHADLTVASSSPAGRRAGELALGTSFSQFFTFLLSSSGGPYNGVPGTEMPYGIGLAVLLGGSLWLVMLFARDLRSSLPTGYFLFGTFCFVEVLVLLYVSSRYFPWAADLGPILNSAIVQLATIQFPWRFVGPAVFLLVVIACCSLSALNTSALRNCVPVACVILVAIAVIESAYGLTAFMNDSKPFHSDYTAPDPQGAGGAGWGREYVPSDVDLVGLLDRVPFLPDVDGEADIISFQKQGTDVNIDVSSQTEADMALPLLWYPHYNVESSGDACRIVRGEDGLVHLIVPPGYSDRAHVYFDVPWQWNATLTLSGLTLVACILAIRLPLPMLPHTSDNSTLPSTGLDSVPDGRK